MTDAPIEAVLRHYGAEHVPHAEGWRPMKCPFHEDRTASASVSTGKDAFNCHACEAKGNSVSLIMWKEGTDFDSAAQIYAEIVGKSYGSVRASPRRLPRKPLSSEPVAYEGSPAEVSFRVRRRPLAGS